MTTDNREKMIEELINNDIKDIVQSAELQDFSFLNDVLRGNGFTQYEKMTNRELLSEYNNSMEICINYTVCDKCESIIKLNESHHDKTEWGDIGGYMILCDCCDKEVSKEFDTTLNYSHKLIHKCKIIKYPEAKYYASMEGM